MGDFYVFLFCYILKTFLIFFFVKKYFINYCIAYKKLGDYRKKYSISYCIAYKKLGDYRKKNQS